MEFIDTLPVWGLAILIFLLRIVDVTMGTVRTLAIVEGLVKLAVALGFLEVLVWILAVSQVIANIRESPLLAVAYAGGFAAGNATGILVEKRLALGGAVVRVISHKAGAAIAEALRAKGQVVTTFSGQGRDGPVTLIYVSCPQKRVQEMLGVAREFDPDIFYVIERSRAWGYGRDVAGHPTGWRAILKKK